MKKITQKRLIITISSIIVIISTILLMSFVLQKKDILNFKLKTFDENKEIKDKKTSNVETGVLEIKKPKRT